MDVDSRQRMMAEIERIVSRAVEERSIVATDTTATQIAREFPGAGLSIAQISAEIARRGVEAGAALQFGETA